MTKVDILFCAWNRKAFTVKSFETLVKNTDWSQVSRLVIYDDGSEDGSLEYLRGVVHLIAVPHVLCATKGLGPVGIMEDFLKSPGAPILTKIDNDTLLPPNWLGECLEVMERDGIDLLGIEARIDAERSGPAPRATYQAAYIGGIGLMRRSIFANDLPGPVERGSRFGFGHWQDQHPEVKKAWINPPLPVCLLNLVPFEPWRSLSLEYIAKKWQRDWPAPYSEDRTDLWEWWT